MKSAPGLAFWRMLLWRVPDRRREQSHFCGLVALRPARRKLPNAAQARPVAAQGDHAEPVPFAGSAGGVCGGVGVVGADG